MSEDKTGKHAIVATEDEVNNGFQLWHHGMPQWP